MMAGEEAAIAARAEFPITRSCVYLNGNSTGAFPRGMQAVLARYWESMAAWDDRTVWEGWWADLHAYADELAALIGAPPGSVATDASLSSLVGRLLTCFDWRGARNRIVCTAGDFPSVPFIGRQMARFGAELVVAPMAADGSYDEAALEALIDERVRLVCVSHASYTTSALLDVPRIARRARDAGALLAVDAYQSVGAVPIDVARLGVDFLLGGAHKWLCGSTETAFLYVRPELLPRLTPAATGWVASRDPLAFAEVREFADTARRFATGTPQVLPAQLSRVGLALLRGVGMETVRALSLRRTARILERAAEARIEVRTPRDPARRGGFVALSFPGAEGAAAELARRGFVCSHRTNLRVAPHFYNTDDEVERFMDALGDVRKGAS